MKSLKINIWKVISIMIAIVIILPFFEIIKSVLTPVSENWNHIQNHLLKDYFITTLKLVLGVLFVATSIAVPLAWILTLYQIPGRRFLKYLLFLPMAIPPHIGTFTYSSLMGYTGAVQQFIRSFYDVAPKLYWMEVRGMPSAIFCFSIFLFPYIYLPCKSFLEKNGGQYIESARLLGDNEWSLFLRLGMPLLKLPILAGATIIALDIFNDYAVASYLGINTFSLAILKSWQNYSDVPSALRLSGILLGMVFLISIVFKRFFSSKGVGYIGAKSKPIIPKKLPLIGQIISSIFVYVIFALSFVIPIAQMLYWSWHSWGNIRKIGLGQMALNTFLLALVSSVIILILALIVANYQRLFPGFVSKNISRICNIGYTIPGAVIAICVLAFL